jgi:hypothetical protein
MRSRYKHSVLGRPGAFLRHHPLGLSLGATLAGVLVLALGVGLTLARQPGAHAATWTVTDCTQYGSSSDSGGTLYDVLATPPADGDTITFDCATAGPILVPSTITINKTLTLDAKPTYDAIGKTVVLDGTDSGRLFEVDPSGTLTLNYLTLQNAHENSSFGGAIQNCGILKINYSSFMNNHASYSGAIANASSGDTCDDGSRNTAFQPTTTVAYSTFDGNSATYNGGAIANDSAPSGVGAGLTVTNSTFYENSAGGGGAIATIGSASIADSTLAGNTATGPHGGGIYAFVASSATPSVAITGSIVAGNSSASSNGNCDATDFVNDNGYNAEDSSADPSADCSFSSTAHDLLVSAATDLDLVSLGDNGGPTQTMALSPASPAIDEGGSSANGCLSVDQRGVSRPQGAACDIGAFELQLPVASLAVGVPQSASGGVTYIAGTTPLVVSAATSEDGVAAASVSYCIYPQGGSCSGGFTKVSSNSSTITLGTTLADGAYTVAYFATDADGASNPTGTTTLTLDNTAPDSTLNIGSPRSNSGGTTFVTSSTPLSVSATDTGSGVGTIYWRIYPEGSTPPAFSQTSSAATAPFYDRLLCDR